MRPFFGRNPELISDFGRREPHQVPGRIINDFVRRRLRELRRAHGLSIRQAARLAGIPHTTYASLEKGDARLNLDTLHRMLAVLESDIGQVWPGPLNEQSSSSPYFWSVQFFRLQELSDLTGSPGVALFAQGDREWRVVMSVGLRPARLLRLRRWLEGGFPPRGFRQLSLDRAPWLVLVLQTTQLPPEVEWLARRYLDIWACALH